MKTVFSMLLLLAFCTNHLVAQEAATKATQPELGVNFTRFLDEAIDFGGGNTSLSPYLVTFKKLDETGTGLRMGAGISFDTEKNKEKDGSTTTVDGSFFNSNINFRIGKEWQRSLSEKWSWYYGLDAISAVGYRNVKSKQNDNEKTTNSVQGGLGGGPVVGLQFMFNKRIGIYTEGSIYFGAAYTHLKNTFGDTGQEDEKETNFRTGLDFNLPSNIYLFIRF